MQNICLGYYDLLLVTLASDLSEDLQGDAALLDIYNQYPMYSTYIYTGHKCSSV
jgi:hypothetical protein